MFRSLILGEASQASHNASHNQLTDMDGNGGKECGGGGGGGGAIATNYAVNGNVKNDIVPWITHQPTTDKPLENGKKINK